jgi:hypothetical protein
MRSADLILGDGYDPQLGIVKHQVSFALERGWIFVQLEGEF